MKRLVALCVVGLLPILSLAQVDKIFIPAGTPADQAIQEITKEADAQKRLALLQDFVQKFASDPAAAAYGNWQISQYYLNAGDPAQALAYGDKALAASPHNLDILVSQAGAAQQVKNNAKLIAYAVQGGETFHSIAKQPKPEGMSDVEFAARVEEEETSAKGSYEYLESAALNAITGEQDPKLRMAMIERFTPAFPGSRYQAQVSQYAIYTLQQLNDSARLLAYGEKTLATDPNSIPTLILLANAYAEDPKAAELNKAITYGRKAIALAKAGAPDADKSRKLSAGVAHSAIGYALLRQEKTAAAIAELKAGSDLLKDDPSSYSTVLYRLGYAYAKVNRVADARQALTEAVKIPGPFQQPSRELLDKINAARSKAR